MLHTSGKQLIRHRYPSIPEQLNGKLKSLMYKFKKASVNNTALLNNVCNTVTGRTCVASRCTLCLASIQKRLQLNNK